MAISSTQVKPGDLISAQFMNTLLDEIQTLENRITALEAGSNGGGAVKINSVVPAGGIGAPIRVDEEIQILGINFGFSTGTQRVFFDGRPVNEFRTGSNDTRLIVPVSPVPPLELPEAGRPVALRVENGPLSDTLNISILPILQTLQGDVDVIWVDDASNPNPDPITPNQPATFAYQLHSRANLAAAFTINPVITVMSGTVPTALANLQVLNATGAVVSDRRITLEPGETSNFSIRVTQVPAGSNGLAFNLNVTATSANLSGSDQRPFTVGTQSEPSDANIKLIFDRFDPVAQFNSAANTISLRRDVIGTMNYLVTFVEAGTYEVSVELGAGTTQWEVGLGNTPAQYIELTENVTENPHFKIRPISGASATGQVIFKINRAGQVVGQTRRYNLVFIP